MGKGKKPIVEIDKDGKVIRYHESVADCNSYNNFSNGVISLVLNGYTKHYRKRMFRFATKQEIATFQALISRIDAPAPVAENTKPIDIPQTPVEVITAEVKPDPEEGLSAFEKMLKRKSTNV